MLSINLAFKRKTDNYEYPEAAEAFFTQIDKEAVARLKEKGYGRTDIETYLSRNNPLLSRMSDSRFAEYLDEVIGGVESVSNDLPDINTLDEIYEACLAQKKDSLVELYEANEMENLMELCESGYEIPDIVKAFDKHSLLSRHFAGDNEVVKKYKDRIFSNLTQKLVISSMDEKEYALSVLKSREEAIMNKYHNSDRGSVTISKAEESSIYCSSLVVDKISVDTLMELWAILYLFSPSPITFSSPMVI